MKKTILIASAAAFLGTATLAPTPAAAMFPFLPIFMKKNPDFKPVNPYAKKAAKPSKKKAASKKKM
jgi:hypothetical protein